MVEQACYTSKAAGERVPTALHDPYLQHFYLIFAWFMRMELAIQRSCESFELPPICSEQESWHLLEIGIYQVQESRAYALPLRWCSGWGYNWLRCTTCFGSLQESKFVLVIFNNYPSARWRTLVSLIDIDVNKEWVSEFETHINVPKQT